MNKYIIIKLILELIAKFVDHHEETNTPKKEEKKAE